MSNIITLANLTAYMTGTTVNSIIGQQVVDAVNRYVDTHTHRVFGEKKQVVDEYYAWNSVVWLRHPDLISVDAVKLGWPGQTQSVVDPSAYYSNPLGRVTFYLYSNPNMSRLYNDYLHISYTYGYTADGFASDSVTPLVPQDLYNAVLGLAAQFYNWASNGNKDIVSTSVGSYRLEFIGAVRSAAGTPSPANNTAEANWLVLDSYKLRRQ